MSTVTVYEFEVWDAVERRWIMQARMGTLQAITAIKGIPALHTSLVVDAARLDAEGFVAKPSKVAY